MTGESPLQAVYFIGVVMFCALFFMMRPVDASNTHDVQELDHQFSVLVESSIKNIN